MPGSYEPLIKCFCEALPKMTHVEKLVIVLDGLDELVPMRSDAASSLSVPGSDAPPDLRWIPRHLPRNVWVIMSVTDGGSYFNALEKVLPFKSLVSCRHSFLGAGEVLPEDILRRRLAHRGLPVSPDNLRAVAEILAAAHPQSPLKADLATLLVKAYAAEASPVPRLTGNGSAADMIQALFARLEATHGQTLVSHAVSLLLLARDGISETELEDLLSCDDDVLNEVGATRTLTMRRLPAMSRIRLLADLDPLLDRVFSNSRLLLRWGSITVRDALHQRYLHEKRQDTRLFHLMFCQYFSNAWVEGKLVGSLDEIVDQHGSAGGAHANLGSQQGGFVPGSPGGINVSSPRHQQLSNPNSSHQHHQQHMLQHRPNPLSLSSSSPGAGGGGGGALLPGSPGTPRNDPGGGGMLGAPGSDASPSPRTRAQRSRALLGGEDAGIPTMAPAAPSPRMLAPHRPSQANLLSLLNNSGSGGIAGANPLRSPRGPLQRTGSFSSLSGGHKERDVPEPRGLVAQPLVYHSGDYNMRKIAELPFHQLRAWPLSEPTSTLLSTEFVEAVCKLGMIDELLLWYREAPPDRSLEAFSRFIKSNLTVLMDSPSQIMQLCYLEASSSAVFADAQVALARRHEAMLLDWVNKPGFRSPCAGHLVGHTSPVTSLVFASPTEDVLVSGSEDGAVTVWDVTSGVEKYTSWLTPHARAVSSLAFAPKAPVLATGSADMHIRLWQFEEGSLIASWSAHVDTVTSLSFSADMRLLASGSLDCTVKLWDTVFLTPPADYGPREGSLVLKYTIVIVQPIHSVLFVGHERNIAVAADNGFLTMWALNTGMGIYSRVATFQGHRQAVRACTISRGLDQLASCSDDGTVRLWIVPVSFKTVSGATTSDKVIMPQTLEYHRGAVATVAYVQPNNVLLSAGEDCTIAMWSSQGAFICSWAAHSLPVSVCAVSSAGTFISGGADCLIKIWDDDNCRMATLPLGYPAEVTCALFSPDSTKIALACGDLSLHVWSFKGVALRRFTDSISIAHVAWSPNGRHLANPNARSAVIRDALSGEVFLELEDHSAGVACTSYSPSGKQLVTSAFDGVIAVWDLRTRTVLVKLEGVHTDWVLGIAFNHSGEKLVSASEDGTAVVWDLTNPGYHQDNRCVHVLTGHGLGVTVCEFSPDSHAIVTGSHDATLRVWDTRSGRLTTTLRGHRSKISSASYTSDGLFIISASGDRTIRWWRSAGGPAVFVFSTLGSPGYGSVTNLGSLVTFGDSCGQVYILKAVAFDRMVLASGSEKRSFGPSGKVKDQATAALHQGSETPDMIRYQEIEYINFYFDDCLNNFFFFFIRLQ